MSSADPVVRSSDDLQSTILAGCKLILKRLPEPAQITRLAELINLLYKWNRVYNLTAIRDRRSMVALHLFDSLAVSPYLDGQHILDVGCGAGLPGLPLAICNPTLSVTLLDSSSKKTRFVRQAVSELGLTNVEVVQSRMQEYRPAQSFDMVISRAVASLQDLYAGTRHLLVPGGRMLFMKGALPQDEMDRLGSLRAALQVESLRVPGLDAQRHLLWLQTPKD